MAHAPPLLTQSRWILYLGGVRPGIGRADSAELLLHKSLTLGRPPCLVVAAAGDRVHSTCKSMQIASAAIPAPLLGSKRSILRSLDGMDGRHALASLCDTIKLARPDWCLSFYSPWIPEAVATIPAWYFVNFHPGILPQLRGYEPDTWAILLGLRESLGCLHLVVDGYDEGAIGWQSTAVRIAEDDTSASVLCSVTRRFIDEMRHWLPLASSGSMPFVAQAPSSGDVLTAALLNDQRHVDFTTDSHDTFMRKSRAFLCHAGESAWLSANIDDKPCRLTSLVLGRDADSGIAAGVMLSAGMNVAPGVWADCRIKVPDGWVDIDYYIL